ncbi:hypothetical protein BKA67DRAFT_363487 [Truncatella angustata]|uniref:Uncharacterized protein n=1 Tax=Truncatella angustata TaxID=152316 RepID=A0A9P8UEE1_9PEZI|nr:uncharacterized protein BKA67DRAFT_363487 [Truncatella angustata]KAH6648418.1 hypothetical protein BKA67DRAFT_363487 [Truncatella angustata]
MKSVQFINFAGPEKPRTSSDKRTTRSQAAKAAHAKVRRQRMHEYQTQGNRSKHSYDDNHPNQGLSIGFASCTVENIYHQEILFALPSNNHSDPFDSFCKTLSLDERRLFDHYFRVVVPLETRHGPPFSDPELYLKCIATQWVPTAIGDEGMLSGVLLYACRSLFILTGNKRYYQMALYYKMRCLRLVNDAISALATEPKLVETTIPRVLQLASDELAMGDTATCKHHMDAVVRLVKLQGGMSKLNSMNGFLRQMVAVFAGPKRIQDISRWLPDADHTTKSECIVPPLYASWQIMSNHLKFSGRESTLVD